MDQSDFPIKKNSTVYFYCKEKKNFENCFLFVYLTIESYTSLIYEYVEEISETLTL